MSEDLQVLATNGGDITMVSDKINTFYGTNYPSFLNLKSKLRIKDFVNALVGIMRTESIPEPIVEEIEAGLYKCVHSYITAYSTLPSDKHREEFRTASKRHSRTLNSVLTYIIQSYKTSGLDTEVKVLNDVIRVKLGSYTLMEENISPRSFKPWYRMLKVLRHVNNNMTIDHTIVICRVLTSLYNVVNEPELLTSEKTKQTKELVNTLSGIPRWSTIDNFKESIVNEIPEIQKGIEELKKTVQILKEHLLNPTKRPPVWAGDMVRALRALERNRRMFVYDNNIPMLSSNSTCSSMLVKGKRITIPGVFASCIEPDYFKDYFPESNIDTIIGFNQDYCISDDLVKLIKAKSKRRFSTVIKQKKPKIRLIHPLNNSEQDRLNYYHNLISYVLNRVQSDCTFDQEKGPAHVKHVMETESSWSLYSMDLTNATDTFSLGLQWLILKELIFNSMPDHAEELSNAWLDIMMSSTHVTIDGKEIEFSFANGQPQGFLSSFPSFAFEHHIVVLTLLRLYEPNTEPSTAYRLLGDDIEITIEDKECVVPQLYVTLLNSANVECNLTKGYMYNPYRPDMSVKIAEFAKYLILDGYELTPIPTKLLVTEGKFDNYIGLAAWYSNHRRVRWSMEELKFFLEQMNPRLSEYYSGIIDTMACLNIPSVFNQYFQRKVDRLRQGHTRDDIAIAQCLLTHSIIYASISKLLGNKPYQNNIHTLIHLSKELKGFLEFIDDPSIISVNNKLSVLRQNTINTYEVMRQLVNSYSSFEDLSDDDIMLVCMIMQTNNSERTRGEIENVMNSMYLLMIDPYTDIVDGELNHYMDRMIELFKSFNISIERSWSSFSKKLPVSYLDNSLSCVNDMLQQKHNITLDQYVSDNMLKIDSLPVFYESEFFDDYSMFTESLIEGPSSDDWGLVI